MVDTSESGVLYVTVTTEGGEQPPDVRLTITNLTSQLERVKVTDAEGVAGFRAIPSGDYDLRAEREGFDAVNKPNIEVYAGHETPVAITLSLSPKRA